MFQFSSSISILFSPSFSSHWYSLDCPPFTFMSHYFYYHLHHFTPRLHKWVRTCDSWLFSLVYLTQHDAIISENGIISFSLWLKYLMVYRYICVYILFTCTLYIHYLLIYVYISFFLYPFISCWATWLISQFSNCEQSAINIGMQVCLFYTPDLHPFTYMPICPREVWQGYKVGLFLVF
jgi:hypothetical protein